MALRRESAGPWLSQCRGVQLHFLVKWGGWPADGDSPLESRSHALTYALKSYVLAICGAARWVVWEEEFVRILPILIMLLSQKCISSNITNLH